MVVSHTTTFAIEDLTALSITCSGCGTSVSLPVATPKAVKSLQAKHDCTSCGASLWLGGDDTAFAREVIATRVGKRTRFELVIDQP